MWIACRPVWAVGNHTMITGMCWSKSGKRMRMKGTSSWSLGSNPNGLRNRSILTLPPAPTLSHNHSLTCFPKYISPTTSNPGPLSVPSNLSSAIFTTTTSDPTPSPTSNLLLPPHPHHYPPRPRPKSDPKRHRRNVRNNVRTAWKSSAVRNDSSSAMGSSCANATGRNCTCLVVDDVTSPLKRARSRALMGN